jgi:hypothetical protein
LDNPAVKRKGLFSQVYKASDKVMEKHGISRELSIIWESQVAWDAFLTKKFGKLTPEALAFLTPFLDEIKKVRQAVSG